MKGNNPVKNLPPYEVSAEALALFNSFNLLTCIVMRYFGEGTDQKSEYGHVDFPRMQEGNVALQVLPSFPNLEGAKYGQTALIPDNITLLNIAQGRPISIGFGLMNRTLCVKNLSNLEIILMIDSYLSNQR